MKTVKQGMKSAICALALGIISLSTAFAQSETERFISTGAHAKAPIGWIEFCAENKGECADVSTLPLNATLNTKSWKELVRINTLVNKQVKPLTDQEHHGVLEKWSYPTDGYGDCEDYVLLKRKLLMTAGWPRSSLLITVVRDQKGDGHAVLMVRTDRGDFVLDNQEADVLLWSETPYQFVKRQSQTNANVWVSLGDPRPAPLTATSN
jgi:predicted transglutaminase-like cysteine proteinase